MAEPAAHLSDDDDSTPAISNQNAPQDVGGVAGKRLQSFIDRIERLESEKSELAEDVKEIYAELKSVGFDPRIVKKIIRLRKVEIEKRREEDELLELYKSAIGME